MKISGSAVGMNSTHSAVKINNSITVTHLSQGANNRMSVSSQGSLSASMNISSEARLQLQERNKLLSNLEKEAKGKNAQSAASQSTSITSVLPSLENGFDKFNFQALKKILEAMKMFHKGYGIQTKLEASNTQSEALRLDLTGGASSNAASTWNRHMEVSTFTGEAETTTFSTEGVVTTSDGRSIGFHMDMEMSREFLQTTQFVKDDTVQILTDPLVINMDVDTADVTDQKFYFDINADGTEDEISQLGSGSGFLALDKNQDGKINDGNELFGVHSGDGFLDLSKYDEDENGWIDENDAVFNDLKVWTKDNNGNDRLLSLKDADVGAIYLGHTSTEFAVKDETNTTQAQIRNTGVYLKESGSVGTVQHVDFAL